MRENVFLALVHYPVYNKNNETIASSVTNFDIHDISRTCRTYDINKYYIITPVSAQIELTKRIIGYWQESSSIQFNKDRNDAFSNTLIINSVKECIEDIENRTAKKVRVLTTSAKIFDNSITYESINKEISGDKDHAYLILFGTGFGLTNEIMNMSYKILEPIRANTRYNHLSVRAAVAIILDRIFKED